MRVGRELEIHSWQSARNVVLDSPSSVLDDLIGAVAGNVRPILIGIRPGKQMIAQIDGCSANALRFGMSYANTRVTLSTPNSPRLKTQHVRSIWPTS